MTSNSKYLGFLFVILGFLFLMDNLNVFTINWSLYIILTGLLLVIVYFLKKELVIFLLPGTMLLIYGILFLYCALTDWQNMVWLWPVLFIAPGIGFLLLYFLKNREPIYSVPGILLIVFGALFFVRKMAYIKFWPIVLIVFGIVYLVRFYQNKEKS